MAIQIWVFTAFSFSPKNFLMRRCCLIHLKNNSTCQRHLLCDDQGGKLEIVGEEAEALVRFLVVENDIAQILRIVVGRFYAGEANGLIATQTRRFIDRARINALEKSVAFWAYDEESACLRQPIQPRKIEEPAIHDGEAAGLRRHQVEYVHFVHFTVRNVDK